MTYIFDAISAVRFTLDGGRAITVASPLTPLSLAHDLGWFTVLDCNNQPVFGVADNQAKQFERIVQTAPPAAPSITYSLI